MLNRRPVSLNEGNYRVSYDPVDPKVATPSLKDKPKHIPRSRLFRVAPCAVDKVECTLQSRTKAKREFAQSFNSAVQMPEGYFATRNLDNKMRLVKKNFACLRLNVTNEKESTNIVDDSENISIKKGDHSPKPGTGSPSHERSRAISKEGMRR